MQPCWTLLGLLSWKKYKTCKIDKLELRGWSYAIRSWFPWNHWSKHMCRTRYCWCKLHRRKDWRHNCQWLSNKRHQCHTCIVRNIPVSQCVPVMPSSQIQTYPSEEDSHSPYCPQGLEVQWSISAMRGCVFGTAMSELASYHNHRSFQSNLAHTSTQILRHPSLGMCHARRGSGHNRWFLQIPEMINCGQTIWPHHHHKVVHSILVHRRMWSRQTQGCTHHSHKGRDHIRQSLQRSLAVNLGKG
jgi:hypothetical protein